MSDPRHNADSDPKRYRCRHVTTSGERCDARLTRDEMLPGMTRVQVWAWVCKRCTHIWLPRDKSREPKVCPKCKSPYWNIPRRQSGRPTQPRDQEATP